LKQRAVSVIPDTGAAIIAAMLRPLKIIIAIKKEQHNFE
jgi:hypothetical protein